MSEKFKHILHKAARVKELVLLKWAILTIKREVYLAKIVENKTVKSIVAHDLVQKVFSTLKISELLQSPKLKIYLWASLAVISTIYIITGYMNISAYYSTKEATAIDDGKRAIIELPSGDITARKQSIKRIVEKGTEDENNEQEIANGDTIINEHSDSSEIEGIGNSSSQQKIIRKSNPTSQFDIQDIRPRVIIILSGLGLSRTTTDNAMSMPAEVALSFSPYANGLGEWTIKAEELGFELLMNLPLEPANYPKSDPGPYGILTSETDKQNIDHLNTVLNLSEERFIGVTAPVSEQFTFSETKIIPILEDLKNKSITFIYTNKPKNYFLPQTAKKLDLSLIAHDVLIDGDLSHAGIEKSIKDAERIAAEKGHVVIMGRPYPITVKHLHDWLRTFQEKGLLLVPLSEIL